MPYQSETTGVATVNRLLVDRGLLFWSGEKSTVRKTLTVATSCGSSFESIVNCVWADATPTLCTNPSARTHDQ
jgi:hypothetical protein